MLDELKDDKEELIKKREGFQAEFKALPDSDPQKDYVFSKIRKIDQDLQTEYYKILEDRGEELPSVPKSKAPENDLIRKQFEATMKSEEERIQQIKDEYIEGD